MSEKAKLNFYTFLVNKEEGGFKEENIKKI